MNRVFLQAVNISVTAGYLTLAILLIRKIFTRSPKWLNVILWALVAIRLFIPFAIQSEISIIPSSETFELNLLTEGNGDYYINTGIDLIDEPLNEYMGDKYFEGVTVRYNFKNDLTAFLAKVWIAGIIIMLIYAAVSFIRLKSMLISATKYEDNVYMSEFVKSPFVLGIFSPKIYIPYDISESQMQFVISHERAHIKRKDHITKIFAYILLSAYWFNPILWLAYKTFCEDLELACDEAVIRDYDHERRQEYSETLLTFGMKGNSFSACPLAFGEVGLKERIKGIMNHKKPTKAIISLSVIIIALFVIFFMTDPVGTGLEDIDVWTERMFENVEYIHVETPESVYDFTGYAVRDEKTIQDFIKELQKIEINKHELSKSLDEDRPKDRIIHLGDVKIYFSMDCTQVWIGNSVKPTYTYRVKDPEYVLRTFFLGYFSDISHAEKFNGQLITEFGDLNSGSIRRYEMRNNLDEYIGIIADTEKTELEFEDDILRAMIYEVAGDELWDGIYPGEIYITLVPRLSSENVGAGYEWLDATEVWYAEKIVVRGLGSDYFLADE